MGMIDISVFTGEIPKLSDKLLPDGGAAKAENCYLEEGNLQAGKGIEADPQTDIDNETISIFRLKDGTFLHWSTDVDVVRSFVPGSDDRVIFTGDGYPKETSQALWPQTRRLGISAPANALTIALDGTPDPGDDGETQKVELSYVYTRIGVWEDGSTVESAPSPPTGVAEVRQGVTPTLTGFEPPSEPGVFFTGYRLYRLNAGNLGSAYQYVDDVIGDSYTDQKGDADLREVLETLGWTSPQDDLTGLTATSHGLVFGFQGNQIFPSQVFAPYAFPAEYTLSTESDVVGLGYTGSLVAVMTKTTPYMLIGQQPETLALRRLGYQQPCIAKRSIVNVPGGVLYASPDGLFFIGESGSGYLFTKDIWTKEQWEEMNPETLMGFYYDGGYYGFFSDTAKGFSIDLEKKDVKHHKLPDKVYGGHYSPFDDTLYLIFGNGVERYIGAWGKGGELQTYIWHSKVFSWPDIHVFTAGKMQGDFSIGQTKFTLHVDGVSAITEKTITSEKIFRIPPKMGTTFQIRLTGKATIDRILVAGSVADIADRE